MPPQNINNPADQTNDPIIPQDNMPADQTEPLIPVEPILDQPTVETASGTTNESNNLAQNPISDDLAGNSSLENSDTSIPSQEVPAQPTQQNEAREMQPAVETAPLNEQSSTFTTPQQPQQVDSSPERVSLTDLSSYKPQDNVQEPLPQSGVPVPDETAKENIYTEICTQIIKEQEQIIGALAVEQAQQVIGLTVDPVSYHCTVTGDGSKVIDDLIEQYRDFFGHAAVEVCKEAASKFVNKLPADALPTSLR